MSKTIEELYRETKEKATTKKKSDSGVVYEKTAPPERWYEKHWGIWLLLIICFPLGIILLCSSKKYSSGSKVGIALAMVCLILYTHDTIHDSLQSDKKPSTQRQASSYTTQSTSQPSEKMIYASGQRSCLCIIDAGDIDGFLEAAHRKDAAYIDAMLARGQAFAVKRNTRVLCSDSKIHSSIVFVTFLEGEYEGMRAYTFAKRVH